MASKQYIFLELNMPTLDEWQNALLMSRDIKIISDDNLIRAVNAKPNSPSHTGSRKLATLAIQVSPNRIQSIMPMELLGSMGLITTPRIDNLVDLCSTWARIRYIWAFNPTPPHNYCTRQLRLSEEALDIDFHQKSLLSDEIGMAMAALIMDKFFNAHNPVDVDVALRHGTIVGLAKVEDASPDFIFQNKTDNSYLVVECKGTRSGYSAALKQLQRGTEQVRSLRFPARAIPSFVIATKMSAEHTYVYVVDPPSNSQGGDSSNKNEITITNESLFRETIRQYQTANIFRYIGSFARAYQITPEKEEAEGRKRFAQVFDPPAEEFLDGIQTTFLGTSQQFRIPGEFGNVRVFQGIPSQLYFALVKKAYDDAEGILAGFNNIIVQITKRAEGSNPGEPGYYLLTRAEEFLSVTLFRKDGTILKIDISS